MDISVIVPIYNVENFVERCLRSLFEQSKTDGVEFIIVNDCTPDGSMEVVRRVVAEYPQLSVNIIEHNDNKGVAAARQTGLEAVNGEYILYIDSDDWCEPTMLEELYLKAKTDNADVVCCDLFENGVYGVKYKKMDMPYSNGVDSAIPYISDKLNGYLFTRLTKTSLFTDNNIKFIDGINYGEDLLVTIMTSIVAEKISYLPKAFYHYNIQNVNSICRNVNTTKLIGIYDTIPKELDKFIERCGVSDRLKAAMVKRKLLSKYNILLQMPKKERKLVANIHPEVNSYISTMTYLSSLVRFGFTQATKGRVFIFNWILTLSSIKNRLKFKR